jgi:hypothetical protein
MNSTLPKYLNKMILKLFCCCLFLIFSMSSSAQLLGTMPGKGYYNSYVFGSAIQLNNGNLLFANADADPAFRPLMNLFPAGGFYAPQTALSPEAIPVIIKHMSDDRYVVASYHNDTDPINAVDTIAISRHLPDGSLDLSFNASGQFRITFFAGECVDVSYPYDLIILDDHSLIITYGTCQGLSPIITNALKLQANGIPDNSFGTNGHLTLPLQWAFRAYTGEYNYRCQSIPILEDNNHNIYFGGRRNGRKCLIRYNNVGVFDSAYGYKMSVDSGDILRLFLDYSGDIIAVGCNVSYSMWTGITPIKWFVRKYKSDGNLNLNFGVNGETTLPFENLNNAFLQPDGKIMLIGQYLDHQLIRGRRLHANGAIDSSFIYDVYDVGDYINCEQGQYVTMGSCLMESDGNLVMASALFDFCNANTFYISRIANNPCGNGNAISSLPVLTASNLNVCQGVLAIDTIFISGILNGSSYWEYYTNMNATPVQVYGNSFTVSPTVTTTYYVRGTGYCSGNGPADSITIYINPPTASYSNATICVNQIPYNWNGLTIDSPGVYTAILTNANGCDSVATLNLSISVCGLCQNGFTANWSPFTDSLVESSSWIKTSGTVLIPLGAKVKFDANVGGYVTLNPGFKVDSGAVFVAQAYNGCTAGAPQLPNAKIFNGETIAATEIVLYPNPTTGLINIKHEEKLSNIQIFDMVGKLVINQKCHSETETNINLSHLPNGVYHVKAAGYNSIKVVKND